MIIGKCGNILELILRPAVLGYGQIAIRFSLIREIVQVQPGVLRRYSFFSLRIDKTDLFIFEDNPSILIERQRRLLHYAKIFYHIQCGIGRFARLRCRDHFPGHFAVFPAFFKQIVLLAAVDGVVMGVGIRVLIVCNV